METTPGFYQGLTGRKTGRPSPRTPVRSPRREQIMADHGMLDQGAADPNQGQLFNTAQMGGRTASARTFDAGAPPAHVAVRPSSGKGNMDIPLGAAPGFMPGLNTKQKVAAINTAGRALGSATPVRDIMENRQVARSKAAPTPWYSGVDAAGKHDVNIPGDANVAIKAAATRQGVSDGAMTRATAITSPQNRWDTGHPSNQGYQMNNLGLAEDTVRRVKGMKDPSDEDIANVANDAVQTGGGGGGLPAMVTKAGTTFRDQGNDTTKPIEIKQRQSQKVPNFEASLHLTHVDPQVRKNAAMSYTVDTHDAAIAGYDEKHSKTVGAYDLMAMTGSRAALKNRELAPNEQAREWVGQRGGTRHVEEEGFFESQRGGKMRVREAAMPPARQELTSALNKSMSRNVRRQSTAERMGLEF